MVVVTAVVLVPVAVPISRVDIRSLSGMFAPDSLTLTGLRNTIVVTVGSTAAAILFAAPAGYVLSRGRGRLVSLYSLLLFGVQSLPVFILVVPLFVMFVHIGFYDNLLALGTIYVGMSLAVATWMMAAYFDTIPVSLEEAAWIDGCSVFGGFVRIVLRNSLPGVLSTAIFGFLIAWNDYLLASIFLKSQENLTLPVSFGGYGGAGVLLLALPPILVFAVLNRYFSVGGIGGSLAN